MEEYIMDVELDNERTTLKTFSRTVEGAIDNIVKMNSVQKLFNIGNVDTQETWEFDEDITKLREVEIEVGEAMRSRKLQAHHGVILRNVIENKENDLDNLWFKRYGSSDSEE